MVDKREVRVGAGGVSLEQEMEGSRCLDSVPKEMCTITQMRKGGGG